VLSTPSARRARQPQRGIVRCYIILSAALLFVGCDRASSNKEPPQIPAKVSEQKPAAEKPKTSAAQNPLSSSAPKDLQRLPAPERLVAIGDLHGDLSATRDVLRLVGAIDGADQWVGDKLVVVQTGDQLDRGDQDRELLDLLAALVPKAKAAGGALHILNGNHETMNVAGDFRYVTAQSFKTFADIAKDKLPAAALREMPGLAHGRAAAFFPGGPYALQMAERPVVLIVGDSVFAHGGVLPKHLDYGLSRLNEEVRRWFEGKGPMPAAIAQDDAPVWDRLYSEGKPDAAACETLAQVLSRLAVKRMVVGHTVQSHGITTACNEQVFRIDVGMSDYYGQEGVAALEIANGKTRILSGDKAPPAAAAE
jgi:hypothetical protein